MSMCKDCFTGVIHEGEPEGQWQKIGGIKSYVATPTGKYSDNKIVLVLTDVFGPQLINNRLLADSFAKNGFKTIIPDYFNDDPLPEDALNPGSTFSREEWLSKHGPAQTRPPLDDVIEALKGEGVTEFAATGYCFGARYVFDLAFEHIIKASAVAHPSRLQVPDDLEKYFSVSRAPLLISSCEIDQAFPDSACKAADSVLNAFPPGYKRVHFDGCKHGFAVRGDLSDPKVKAGKEGAFQETVEWFNKYL